MPIVKVIEVLAQSNKSWDDAVQVALNEAKKSVRNIQSIYVKEFQVDVENEAIVSYRINAKVSFLVEDSAR